MSRRAFTLVEVLISLAMFALAAISLGAAYTNVVLSRQALKVNDVAVDDLARARAALLETINYDDVTTGGEINLPGDRLATWQGEIEATSVSDLFSVTLTVEIQNADGTDAPPLTPAPPPDLVRPRRPPEDPRRGQAAARDRARLHRDLRRRLHRGPQRADPVQQDRVDPRCPRRRRREEARGRHERQRQADHGQAGRDARPDARQRDQADPD